MDALDVLEKEHSAPLTRNKASQDKVRHACQGVRAVLENELKRDDLTAEDRLIIIRMIMETANREFGGRVLLDDDEDRRE